MDNVTAIILAAGKGTRMKSTDVNKVAMHVDGEPMVARTISILRNSGISSIVVVVGFAKESVIKVLPEGVTVAEQNEQLGTGHAVMCALDKVADAAKDVLIVNGDDAFMYNPSVFQGLHEVHVSQKAVVTFITMNSESPTGFGRIVRDGKGTVVEIVEEKNANEEQKKIKEINLGCYLIDKNYLSKNLEKIDKNEISGEYYITDLIDYIAKRNERIATYTLKDSKWQGVNTPDDLKMAESMFH